MGAAEIHPALTALPRQSRGWRPGRAVRSGPDRLLPFSCARGTFKALSKRPSANLSLWRNAKR